MLAPVSRALVVCTSKVYSGVGVDIVMESISLKIPLGRTMSAIENFSPIIARTVEIPRLKHVEPSIVCR